MHWTAAKIDAVELIYALKVSGAINNGNIDIAELVTLFEIIFQLDLGSILLQIHRHHQPQKRDPCLPQQTHQRPPPLDHRQNGPINTKDSSLRTAHCGGCCKGFALVCILLIRLRPAAV
jgi:hypothetical protein